KARQQPQRGDQRDPAVFLPPALHGQGEGKDQTDSAGQPGGNRLLQQEALGIIDEDTLERGQRGPENDPGLQGFRQPDDELPTQPGDTQNEEQQGKVQRQRRHCLQTQGGVIPRTDGERQNQRQRWRQPAGRVGLAEYDQRGAEKNGVNHRGRNRFLERQTEEHGHQRDQRQAGGSGNEDALQQFRPIQSRVIERQAEGKGSPAPAWQFRSRHGHLL